MANPKVLISIKSDEATQSARFGREFIQALCDIDERLIPQQLSISENFNDPFIDVDEFLENWWAKPSKSYVDGRPDHEGFWGPHWRRRSSVHGQVDLRSMACLNLGLWDSNYGN